MLCEERVSRRDETGDTEFGWSDTVVMAERSTLHAHHHGLQATRAATSRTVAVIPTMTLVPQLPGHGSHLYPGLSLLSRG